MQQTAESDGRQLYTKKKVRTTSYAIGSKRLPKERFHSIRLPDERTHPTLKLNNAVEFPNRNAFHRVCNVEVLLAQTKPISPSFSRRKGMHDADRYAAQCVY